MTENKQNYPSCIKIPSSKQDYKNVQYQTKESLPLEVHQKRILHANNALLSLANQIFGEEKWSHSVTSQTLDFVDSVWNSYAVGCCTFVKIQLCSGIFHEDIGYSTKEGSVKGEVIHCARLASYNDALTKALLSFGGKIKTEVEKLSKRFSESLAINKSKVPSPVSHDTNETKEKKVPTVMVNVSSPTPQILQATTDNIPPNNITCTKDQVTLKPNICTDQGETSDKKLSTEELLRLERKRKQMEKQLEYKKLMKEKELKKNNNE
ncbi:hypothetical protein KPH14_003142 [Odynerus spinipes]|uniref:DNA repair protein RAD52-like protein n=1 Tax=Odynerus spinipes TaxID=1348599 RepID=A0AAD9VVA8_9HYME|nr:hypothetical protein KPH14_003142 [Odynerus spinipes]